MRVRLSFSHLKSAASRLVLAVAVFALAAVTLTQVLSRPASAANGPAAKPAASAGNSAPRVFAYYYLWWSADHWRSALGAKYPVNASPLPLPATVDGTGCNPSSRYAGNTLTDVPQKLYSQDDPGSIEADVRQAAAAGLAGFAVNWAGTGQAGQSVTSNPYSKRLQLMVDAVHKVNSEGIPFKLWLSYKASAKVLPQSAILNDLSYFKAKYGNDPAFDRVRSGRPTVIWQGSRKYSVSVLQAVGGQFRSKFRILGDETSWSTSRAPYLDGNAYYWSSQDPYKNPQSFQQLAALASSVRASGSNPDGSAKAWVAPITPGYDKQLSGGSSCVPRKGGQTVKKLFDGNAATHPDDFGLISWNEISEGSYIDPMTRFGATDLNMLASVIKNGG
ncbi:MAG: hypothetical protein QOE71_863 [Pseudonocardiales bacterium]|nr:hypothetical protein [Pseudonocardiales bacterium]